MPVWLVRTATGAPVCAHHTLMLCKDREMKCITAAEHSLVQCPCTLSLLAEAMRVLSWLIAMSETSAWWPLKVARRRPL